MCKLHLHGCHPSKCHFVNNEYDHELPLLDKLAVCVCVCNRIRVLNLVVLDLNERNADPLVIAEPASSQLEARC